MNILNKNSQAAPIAPFYCPQNKARKDAYCSTCRFRATLCTLLSTVEIERAARAKKARHAQYDKVRYARTRKTSNKSAQQKELYSLLGSAC